MDLYAAALWAVAGFAWGMLSAHLEHRARQADAAGSATLEAARIWLRDEAAVREDETVYEASARLDRHVRKFEADMDRCEAEGRRAWWWVFAWYKLTIVGVPAIFILSVARAAWTA